MVIIVVVALLVAHRLGGAHRAHAVEATTTTTEPVRLSVGVATCTFVDATRATKDYVTETSTPSRRLVTDIYYPSLAGHPGPAPAERYGPFPTIFFAEGYGIDPGSYAALLEGWARQRFVVVAPMFPDASAAAVAAIHGSFADEADIPNQPGDLAFVTHRVLADSAAGTRGSSGAGGCPVLRGLVSPSELGLAGQSDGATTVAMLAYDDGTLPGTTTTYRSLSNGLRYRAVAVLSGEAYGSDPYAGGGSSPALLSVQSATDQCNTPEQSVDLYSAIDQSDRWFLAIRTADHLTPYEGQDAAAFAVVSATTVAFFAAELHGEAPGPSFLALGNRAPSVAVLVQGADLPSWLDVAAGSGGLGCYQT